MHGAYQLIENNDVESFRITDTTNCDFISHTHNLVELLYIVQGRILAMVNGKDHILIQGELMLIYSYKIHSYNSIEPTRCIRCVFEPELIAGFDDLMRVDLYDAACIRASNTAADHASVIRSLLNEWRGQSNRMVIIGYLNVLFGRLQAFGEFFPANKEINPTVHRIITYLCENFRDSITLESAAGDLGISRHHLSRLCNNEIGFNLCYYINYLRTNVACRLLRKTNMHIREVAMSCGFGSLRSFNRAFFQIIGIQPKEYRRIAAISPPVPEITVPEPREQQKQE